MSGEMILDLLAPLLAILLVGGALFSERFGRWRGPVEALMIFGLMPLFAWAVGSASILALVAPDWPALAINLGLLAVVIWTMIGLVRRRAGRSRS